MSQARIARSACGQEGARQPRLAAELAEWWEDGPQTELVAGHLESVLTYEGTEEIHTLALGQAITGIPAYR